MKAKRDKSNTKKNKIYVKVLVAFLLFVCIVGVAIFFISDTYTKNAPTTSTIPTTKIFPTFLSPTIEVLSIPTNNVNTSQWKTYADVVYSFSIQYPPTWIVHTTDIKQGLFYGNPVTCETVHPYLRDPNSCNSDLVVHDFTIDNPADNTYGDIEFYIPTGGGGGGGNEKQIQVEINKKTYTLDINYLEKPRFNGTKGGYLGTFWFQNASPIPGNNSIWKEVFSHYSIPENELPIFVKMLESIKTF